MTTTEPTGPLQAARAAVQQLRDDVRLSGATRQLADALHVVLTALVPAAQLAIDTRERVLATDRDVGILAERLQSAERRLDTPNPDIRHLSGLLDTVVGRISALELSIGCTRSVGQSDMHERITALEQRRHEGLGQLGDLQGDVRELAARDQLMAGKWDGLRTRLDRTVADLRGAEGAIGELSKMFADQFAKMGDGSLTVNIERVQIGDSIGDLHEAVTDDEIKGAAIAADLMAAEKRRRALMAKPLTPQLVAESSGEDLDWIADLLGLMRKDLPRRETESDEALRLRCGTALFAQHMTREWAELVAKQAAQNHAKRGAVLGAFSYLADSHKPDWRPHEWVIDAVMAAAGARSMAEETPTELVARLRAESEIGSKDRDELAQAHMDAERLRNILADVAHVLRVNHVEHGRWREIPQVIAGLCASLAAERADRAQLLRTSNADMAQVSKERDGLRAGFDAEMARLSKVHEQSLAREHKRIADRDAWRARLALVLHTRDDSHSIEAAVNRMAQRAEELDRIRSERSVTLDAQTAELEELRTQRAEHSTALDRAHAELDEERRKVTERDAEVHRWIDLKGTAQAQLDKFTGACSEQACTIMELRGEVARLTAIADRAKAADMLIAVMPAWAEMADCTVPLAYERTLLRVWNEVKALVAPAAGPTETDQAPDEPDEPLSGL